MILKLYSIHDAKAEIFHPPFFNKTHAEAERNFTQLANDDKGQVSQFPEDFDLYYMGEFDDNNGKLSPLPTPQHMVKAIQVRQARNFAPIPPQAGSDPKIAKMHQ